MIRNLFKNLKLTNFLTILTLITLIPGCGIYKPVDARKVPVNVNDRAEKNIKEGKGFRVFDKARQGGGGTGVFSFASSNPMWRASINLLDFAPFSNVDYSGGIIITDWFSDENTENESLKITVKFLSNEIRADGINVIIHKKKCTNNGQCKVSKIDSTLANEIKVAILKEATILQANDPNLNPGKDYKMPEGLK
tara:strand:+ start:141 stop:722 length:582 start_codon:yes stop_codon:yes gene_type:complete